MDATIRTTTHVTKQRALINAIQLCGGRARLAKIIGASVNKINNWLNRGDKVPYEYAFTIHMITNGAVSVDQLTPKRNIANKFFRNYEQKKICRAELISINLIKTSNILERSYVSNTMNNNTVSLLSDDIFGRDIFRPILVDQDYQIIAGYDQLICQQQLERRQVSAHVINLATIIKKRSLLNVDDFKISERVLIGLALEQFIGDRQGLRTDLNPHKQLVPNLAQVPKASKKTRFVASNAIGFKHSTYLKAKKVVLNGSWLLIQAMDQNLLSIHRAYKLTNLSMANQENVLSKICPSLVLVRSTVQ